MMITANLDSFLPVMIDEANPDINHVNVLQQLSDLLY